MMDIIIYGLVQTKYIIKINCKIILEKFYYKLKITL